MNNKDYTDEQWGTHIFRYCTNEECECPPLYVQKINICCINCGLKKSFGDVMFKLTCNEVIIKGIID